MRATPAHVLLTKSWGERVRSRRTGLGLTQAALAERVGCHQSTVSEIETGSYAAIKPEMLLRIAVALDIEPEQLFPWPHGIGMVAATQAVA